MRIGELAARVGMTKDGVRFYERAGLLDGDRLPNGYRDFPEEAVEWLRYVRTAQRLGFTLAEIARHGERLRAAPDREEMLSAMMLEKVAVIDERMRSLAELRAELVERAGSGCVLRPDAQASASALRSR